MNQAQFTVGTTAVKVFTGPGNVQIASVNGSTAYIGSSSVVAGDGLPVSPSSFHFQAKVADDGEIWAIVNAGTSDLRVVSWY